MRQAIEFLYEKTVVPLSVICISIFLFFKIETKEDSPVEYVIWFLAPATLVLCATLVLRLCLLAYDHGIVLWLWRFVKSCWDQGIVYAVSGYNMINSWKLGRILWGLAFVNLFWFLYWIYYNVDLFRVFNDIYALVFNMLWYLYSPKQIIVAYINLLRTLKALNLLVSIQSTYIAWIKYLTEEGSVVVFTISVVAGTAVLILFGAFPHIMSQLIQIFSVPPQTDVIHPNDLPSPQPCQQQQSIHNQTENDNQ
jgi:hypothetical protein